MKSLIVADFEWCVTPHATRGNSRFFLYFNEILSVGAVRVQENGLISDRLYSLVRPEAADYIHPVILDCLGLDRAALAAAPVFSDVFSQLLTFIGDLPVYTWGGSDASALRQNLKIKLPAQLDRMPLFRDVQPWTCKRLEIPSPYPSLSSVLAKAGIAQNHRRHNALTDAEDTAGLFRVLCQKNPDALHPLFFPNKKLR